MNGAQLRDEGMAKAAAHADRLHEAWQERAMGFLKEFSIRCWASASQHNFTAEDVYDYAERYGLPRPPDRRAWGAVMTKAAKQGIIRKVGYGVSARPECHNRPVTMWERV